MNQQRSKDFRKVFGKDRRQYKAFKKRYVQSPLPLQLEVLKLVERIKKTGNINFLEHDHGGK